MSRHKTVALQLNLFPDMEGSNDKERIERSEQRRGSMWQQPDSSVAGTCWWIRGGQWPVDPMLHPPTWWIEALSKKTSITVFDHTKPPHGLSPILIHQSLYLCLSLLVYLHIPRNCTESRFSLSKWPDCFSTGEFTSDVYTEAWTGPQAMPAIDFAMILIRGLPVAINTIYQWTPQ